MTWTFFATTTTLPLPTTTRARASISPTQLSAYLLEPCHLVAYHGNWYLLALNTAAGRMETFALSRCRSLAGTGQHFPSPVAFDPKTFFKDSFGIS